jgi:hypothetical protein
LEQSRKFYGRYIPGKSNLYEVFKKQGIAKIQQADVTNTASQSEKEQNSAISPENSEIKKSTCSKTITQRNKAKHVKHICIKYVNKCKLTFTKAIGDV